ncbi:MAG TPA: glycosyltransferase family 39 protein [Vicinamibacterales bacterium]|nr:glycosyltransferase family 39 protein [Vicinamibacterales bacterium]
MFLNSVRERPAFRPAANGPAGSRARAIARWWPLAAALGAGALLRFWGIGSGLPYSVGSDEPPIMSIAVRMMRTGDLHPHFFDYPTLYIYVQLVTACARFVTGAKQGMWSSLDQAGVEDFYLWGRVVTAALGVATIALVHASGSRFGRAQAALAAAIMAVLPMHVRESHFALTDVPVTFVTALALLLGLRALEAPSARAFVWAGAAVGFAVATKYNALPAIVMPLIAVRAAHDGRAVRNLTIVLASSGLAFLLAAPYTALDLPAFLDAFAYLASSYHVRPGAEPGWSLYLKHLRIALGWPGLLFLFAGCGYALVHALKRPAPARWWMLAAFPILYFAFISRQGLIFGRYLLPITPFAALLIAIAVIRTADLTRRAGASSRMRAAVAAALTVAVLLPQARTAIAYGRSITRPSTRGVAYEWILQNVPQGSMVVSENFEIRLPERLYRTDPVRRLADRSYEDYQQAGVTHLIASSYVFGPVVDGHAGEDARAAYLHLVSRAREVLRVSPSDTLAGPEVRVYAVDPPKN